MKIFLIDSVSIPSHIFFVFTFQSSFNENSFTIILQTLLEKIIILSFFSCIQWWFFFNFFSIWWFFKLIIWISFFVDAARKFSYTEMLWISLLKENDFSSISLSPFCIHFFGKLFLKEKKWILFFAFSSSFSHLPVCISFPKPIFVNKLQ